MSTKIVSVFGATGTQGRSVVKALLKDRRYSIRALTRDPESRNAEALRTLSIASVVYVDIQNLESVQNAVAGSHIIFGMTDFYRSFAHEGPDIAMETEKLYGITLSKAASATETLEHYIWSTLPDTTKLSGGRITVPHFQGKSLVDEYIRFDKKLLAKTTFLWLGFYANNFQSAPLYQPIKIPTAECDKYIQLQATPPSVRFMSLGDADVNIGLFVRAIIEKSHITLPGSYVLAYVETMSAEEMLDTWAATTGNIAVFMKVGREEYYKLWPRWAEEMDKMHTFWETVGEKSWSSDFKVLTKDDLDIRELVDTATAFRNMRD